MITKETHQGPMVEVATKARKPVGPSLVDTVVEASAGNRDQAGQVLEQFLCEPSPGKALALWLGRSTISREGLTPPQLARCLNRDIARLDALLSEQVNAILHHPHLQRLETSWRGLHYLVRQVPEGENIKVRVLNISWRELVRDLERSLEFDQSQLFRQVYSSEFGTPGGEPFGVLLGDYEIRPRPGLGHPTDDVAALAAISAVAAAAFAPFLAAAHPSLLDLEAFAELERPGNLARTFEQPEYVKWRAFRRTEDARFVGLTLPRVLMRLPYPDCAPRVDGFRFCEEVEKPDRSQYLWGNAVYAFGAVLIRTFAQSGWLATIRGVPPVEEGGGLVTGLPIPACDTDQAGVAPRCSTDVVITDAQDKALGELGFLPLCHCQDTEWAAFHGSQSVQQPALYDETAATVNARLSAMLPYVFCVARVAHYLKVISRDKLGSFAGPADCEAYLGRWLSRYTNSNEKASLEMRARYPLREARVRVRERPDKPGQYLCVAHLRPHFQLDQMMSAVKLVTELGPSPAA
jgi:type VI secretion system ImpC/EvpB family protein